MTGYIHPQYAQSLSEFGTPLELPRCRGWVLVRPIAGFPYKDAMGCYPIFACRDWSQLQSDLENLEHNLVSLALVPDPFGTYSEEDLRRCFPDVAIRFKEHFIVELDRPVNKIASKHHRYYARKALAQVQVEKCDDPTDFIDEWISLYDILIERHNVRGIQAFSRTSFAKQMRVPGLVMFRAVSGGVTVGAHLWYVQRDVACSHLAAFSPLGYELMVSYALYWSGIEYFLDRVRWLNLGAGAGVRSDGQDGLTFFKRGWSTGTRPAYFCGRIFDHDKYAEIVQARGIPPTDYFPAYRKGEFG